VLTCCSSFASSPTLAEWDPKWFRLFVSDVSNDCTEKVLIEAFSKYPSFQKARVIKDRLSNKVRFYPVACSLREWPLLTVSPVLPLL
jgi:RNA recognition motif-containing protein